MIVNPAKRSKDRAAWVGNVLLFLMLAFPMMLVFAYVKIVLFAVIVIGVAITALETGQLLDWSVFLWAFALSMLGALFVIEGLLAGAPGAMRTSPTYVLWPIIYVLAIAGVRSSGIWLGLMRTCTVATIVIVAISVLLLLSEIQILPDSGLLGLLSFEFENTEFRIGEGFVAMQFPGINSLAFLFPFVMAVTATFVPQIGKASRNGRFWQWTATVLGLTGALISGRRAFQIVALSAPAFVFLFSSFLPQAQRKITWVSLGRVTAICALGVLIVLAVVGPIVGISMTGVTNRLVAGVDLGPMAEYGAVERQVQFKALLAGWADSPLLGAGLGRPAFGSIRSPKSPWNYELSYAALLYQTGILGVVAYSAAVFWIYRMGVRVIRSGGQMAALMVACLVGMTSLLIANATNPYLARYDGMYPIFFPLALINYWLVHRKGTRLGISPESSLTN